MVSVHELETSRVEKFAGRLVRVLNDGALALMLGIGHRVGLFDAMDGLPPSTSGAIAATAGLQERYVREWLGAMTVAGIVEYDASHATYRLPAEHAASLTRAAGSGNLAGPIQFVGMLARVEAEVARCFREGGGVAYENYPEFHELMAEDTAALHDAVLVDEVVPLVPGLRERLDSGIAVADIGCGTGHTLNLLARTFPRSSFTGYDIAAEALEVGRREAREWGLANVDLVVRDVATLHEPGRFDLVTAFDAIHDQAHPDRVLARVAQALKPDGVFLMADFAASSELDDNRAHPMAPFIYTVSTMHCMTVSLSQGGLGLGTAWGEQLALRMLRDAGFAHVEIRRVEADVFNNYYIAARH